MGKNTSMHSVFLSFLKTIQWVLPCCFGYEWMGISTVSNMDVLSIFGLGGREKGCLCVQAFFRVLERTDRAGSCSRPGSLLSSQAMLELMCVWTGAVARHGWCTAWGVLDKQEKCPDQVQTFCMLLCSARWLTEWACSKWWFPHRYSNSRDQIMLLGNAGLCSDSATATRWSPLLLQWLKMAGVWKWRWRSPLNTNYSSFPTQIRFLACSLRPAWFVFVWKTQNCDGLCLHLNMACSYQNCVHHRRLWLTISFRVLHTHPSLNI